MVREHIWRRRKYAAKTDGSVAQVRVEAYKADMADLHAAITTVLVQKEIEAKTTVLEPAGVTTSETPFYLNAMREFCKCCREFSSTTRDNKCYSILCTYRDKGLLVNLLYKLAALCGCYPIGYYEYV